MMLRPAAETALARSTTGVPRDRTEVCGLRFDNLTLTEAVEQIDELVRTGHGAYVVTPNVDHVIRANRDPAYASIVRQADLVLADGQPVLWAAWLAGTSLKARVAGSDLFPLLCGHAAATGLRVFFLGGAPGAAAAAARMLERQYPGLNVSGIHCPPFGFERDRELQLATVRAVQSAHPDIVFVGLGSPKQERWIVEHMHEYGPAVSIGVGISFSFAAGHIKRAPRWMRRCGLEWLHRLWREPRRLWKRYLIDGLCFLPLLVGSLVSRVRARPAPFTYEPMRIDE